MDRYEKEHDPKLGDALVKLAAVHYDHKRLEACVQCERKALNFFASRPDDVDKLAKTMYNLAITLCESGRREESVQLQKKCLSLYESFLPAGQFHKQFGAVMDNLVVGQLLLGNHEQAIQLSKKALTYYQTHLKTGHPLIQRALDVVDLSTTIGPLMDVKPSTKLEADPPVSTVTTATQVITMRTATTASPAAEITTVTSPSATTTTVP